MLECGPTDEIQELFFKFTNEKKALPGAVIQQIQLRYAEKIKKQNEAYLKNIDGNPLAHLRIRLDIAYKIVRDSLKERPSHTVRLSEDELEVVFKADNPTAINAIKMAIQDLNKREELDIEKNKAITPYTTNSTWTFNDGISDVG